MLRRIRGQVIPPGSWNWDAVPPHLRVSFRVVDSRGKVLDEGKDLTALQERLAPATRRAIAESLGATPGTTAPAVQGKAAAKAKAGANGKDGRASRPARRRRPPWPLPQPRPGGFTEQSGLTDWTFGTVQRQVQGTVGGHTVTGYPALVDEGTSVALRLFQTPSEQQEAMRGGVIRLLALKVPPPDRYVLEHLNNTEKLTFSQNPHGSVAALIADCALAAIDKLTPAALPWDEASFKALYERSGRS